MKSAKLKNVFVWGLVVTVVIAAVIYILIKVIGFLEVFIAPIAKRLGMANLFGEITITILSIVAIIVIMFILGAITSMPFISRYRQKFEDLLVRLYPPLSYFKVMADEKMNVQSASGNWKAVLALIDDQYWPAFITEENEEWATLNVVYAPNSDPMEVLVARKDSLHCIPMTTKQMFAINRMYGKGFISMLPRTKSVSQN